MNGCFDIRVLVAAIAVGILGMRSSVWSATWHVDAQASSEGDGTSWATAFQSLTNAIAQASNGDEIWVAQGTYFWTNESGLSVSHHTLVGGYPTGGGLRDPEANPTILDCQSARRAFYKTGAAERFTLDGFRVINGVAIGDQKGGAIYAIEGPLTIANCVFSNNVATYHGGAIYTEAAGVENIFSTCRFLDNRATDAWNGYGGAVAFRYAGTSRFERCTFTTNSAGYNGGAIAAGLSEVGGQLSMTDCVFSNNVAGTLGGGIWARSHLECSQGTNAFVHNVATYYGGAVCSSYSGHSNAFVNCIFDNNRTTHVGDGQGGAIMIQYAGTSRFEHCSFTANRSGRGGGALRLGQMESGGLYRLKDCLFANNVAAIAEGGAIESWGGLECVRVDFDHNEAEYAGGAVILRNTAGQECRFQNCAFTGNRTAAYLGGGAIYAHSDFTMTTTVENCTFVGNQSECWGGAIRWNSGLATLTIINSIFWGNIIPGSYTGTNIQNAGTVKITYSDLDVGEGAVNGGTKNLGVGLMHVDPLLASASAPYDVHLKSRYGRWDPVTHGWVNDAEHSPCIDAGDPASDWSNEPTRRNGERINLGRYGNTGEASRSSGPTGTLIFVR